MSVFKTDILTSNGSYISMFKTNGNTIFCFELAIDEGDAHILASAQETKASFLVTLDKKHLLSLKNKIKWLKILTPGELIELIGNKKEQAAKLEEL